MSFSLCNLLSAVMVIPALLGSRALGLPQAPWMRPDNIKLGSPPVVVPSSLGSVHVINTCPFSVQSNIIHAPRPGVVGPPEDILSTLQPGHHASHPFAHDPNMGISWKLTREGAGPVQFEWTWATQQQKIFWDLSMINAQTSARTGLVQKRCEEEDACHYHEDRHHDDAESSAVENGTEHAFAEYGLSVKIMIDDREANKAEVGGTCIPITCPEGSSVCSTAYNASSDWEQQHDCPEHVSLQLTLCG